ncbi:hypothetical protein [Bacillus sp. FSL R9-9410]|uniref:hypothetical protein n=1 Tax=Bacillus sp. FSL R9-9410 TaxID=2921590 RepID=UPI003100EA60
MDEQELTVKKTDSIYFRTTHPYKVDAKKIKTLDDVIKNIDLMDIRLDDKEEKR